MESNFYRDELHEMRNNYKNTPLKALNLNRPIWLASQDPLFEIYSKKSLLLQQGEIVYASLVQANTMLFKSFPPINLPAQIVYSSELYFTEHPEELQNVAWKIYKYKGQALDTVPAEWKEVSRVITDEYDRSDFTFSLDVANQRLEYRMIPTMIYRKLLPNRKLCGSLIPVLTVPECKQVLILPSKYWTEKFTEAWVKGII